MLGEKMGTMTAKVVNKVNPANNGLPSFESSTEGSGTLVGVEVQQCQPIKLKCFQAEVCTENVLILVLLWLKMESQHLGQQVLVLLQKMVVLNLEVVVTSKQLHLP